MSTNVIPMPPAGVLPPGPFNLLFPNVYSSEGTDKILPALFKALTEITPAAKDSENPHFRSKYADLAANYDAAKPALLANKIVVLQPPGNAQKDGVSVSTVLFHESGQWVANILEMPIASGAITDPQAVGKTQTYARRYSFNGFLGISSEDDDGNAGSGAGNQPPNRAPRTPVKPGPVPVPQGQTEICADCGKEIKPIKGANGDMHTVDALIKRSHMKYNRKMCGKCQTKAAQAEKAAAGAPIGVPAGDTQTTTAAN